MPPTLRTFAPGHHSPTHLTAASQERHRSATFHSGILHACRIWGASENRLLITVSAEQHPGWSCSLGKELRCLWNWSKPDRQVLYPHGSVTFRHHAGFIKEGGFWEGPSLIWDYLWRLVPYYVWDLALHIKTPPDIGNELHLFTPYQHRIEMTYLRGKQETPLVRLNRKDVDAPYYYQRNSSPRRPRAYPMKAAPYRDNNFEFTRDYTDRTGWLYQAKVSVFRSSKRKRRTASLPRPVRAKSSSKT